MVILIFYASIIFEKINMESMESMSGGFVRVLSEPKDKIGINQQINVLNDNMEDESFEVTLEFQINDDEKYDVSKYKRYFQVRSKRPL